MFDSYKISDVPLQIIESYALSFIPSVLKSIYKWIDPYEKIIVLIGLKRCSCVFPMFAPNKIDPIR